MKTVIVPGALFGAAVVGRTALDWFVPPQDFHVRAAVSTYVAMAILLLTGFLVARRSGSLAAGIVAAVAAAAIGAGVSLLGALGLLALWHDPERLAAIRGSGGLAEAFTLPLLMVLPAAVVGTLGGLVGLVGRRLRPTA